MKTLHKLKYLILGAILAITGTVYAVQISVPSAPAKGYFLISPAAGNYQASSTQTAYFGNYVATTTTATSTFFGNVLITDGTNLGFTTGAQPFEISGSINFPYQMIVSNKSTGGAALSGYTLANSNYTNNANPFLDTYYAGLYEAGTGFNTYPGLQPNDAVFVNSDGNLRLAALSTNSASSSITFSVGPGFTTANYDAGFYASTTLGQAFFGIATTSPQFRLQVNATNSPQFAVGGQNTDNLWTFRGIGNQFFIATASPTTWATSSTAALTIDTNGKVKANCFTTDGSTCITGGGGSVTAVTATWPVISSGGATPNITWGGLATSSGLTNGQVLYATGVNTVASVGTSSIANGTNITVTNGSTAYVSGAQPTINLSGVIATSLGGTNNGSLTADQVLYTDHAGTKVVSTATSTESCTSPLSCTGFDVLKNGGAITLGTVTVAKGGTNQTSFANNSIITSDATGANLIATTSQLTVGSLISTTTNSSWFLGKLGIATSSNPSVLTISPSSAQLISANPVALFGTSTLSGASANGTYFGINSPTGYTGDYFNIQNNNATAFQVSAATNGLLLLGTTTSSTVPGKLIIASTTTSQLTLQGATGDIPWNFRSIGGLFYIATSSATAQATSTTAAFKIDANGKVTANCYTTDGSTCITGGGSGTVTNVATGYGLHGGAITTTGTLTTNTFATLVVSTSSATGDYTDLQTALNAVPAAGGHVHMTCGTFALSATTTIKVAGTILDGEGICTELTVNAPTVFTGLGFSIDNLTNVKISNLWIHQTQGTQAGFGIDASNTPLLVVDNIKIDGFSTSTRLKDTKNETFYQHWSNMDLRDNKSCIDIGGLPVNDNIFENIRCATHSGSGGFALFLTSSSVNGAQNNTFINFDSEPTGAATGLTAIYADNAVDNTFIRPYVEGNAVAWNFTANSQRNQFDGGEFVTNTTYTNNGSNNQWLNVDKEGQAMQLIEASSTIADVSGGDASTPSLTFIGNTNFAKTASVIDITLANSTDSGNGVRVTNPGTGAGLRINSSGTGQAATTTGTWFMHGLAVSTSGNAVCINTSTFSLENAGAGACVVSTQKAKHDIQTISSTNADEIMKLNAVSYTLNGGDEQRYGFIAEEVAKIDPKLVEYAQEDTTVTGIDGKPVIVKKGDPLTFDYQRFTGLLTAKVQDMQHQIDSMKVGAVKDVQDNWQWLAIGLLALWNIYLTFRKNGR